MSHAPEATAELKALVLEILRPHVGRENRIYRSDLVAEVARRLQVEPDERLDRNIRDAIEEARGEPGEGSTVCSSSRQGGGYWQAGNADELEASISEEEGRGHSILTKTSSQRRHGLEWLRARPFEQARLL